MIIHMQGITKKFPGVVANDRANLAVQAGTIHALLGENGAGKTTLMNVLYGLYQPEEGQIFIRGQAHRITSPRQAMDLGIGMVHQHFMLVPVLSVAENIILGLPSSRGPLLDLPAAERAIAELSESSGLAVDPRAKVWQLPVGVQQRVEILKFLYRGVDILILDEPTAVLTPDEVSHFFDVLRTLQARGVTIILITHKLNEVMAISHQVTVMRAGRDVATVETSATNPQELARLLVGREVVFQIAKPPRLPGDTVLEIKDLNVQDDRELPAVQGVSLSIRAGEILGIAGVSGNGQTELTEAITGIRRVSQGCISLCERDITNCSPRQVIQAGVAQIPSDRHSMGTVEGFSLAENTVLSVVDNPPFSRHGVLNWAQIQRYGEHLIQDFDVKAASANIPAGWLSGGNLQKLILAREIARAPKLLIANQPTRGLDVAAIEYVHYKLLAERERGAAILLISSELDEIMALSDKIAVIYEGRIVGIVSQEEADVSDIALLMTGALKKL
jgi:simple sugar transport system ATP-binding protein